MTTFIDDVLAGRAKLDAVDDHIDRWHNGEDERSLSQFLGLSTEEYAAWIADVDALTDIMATSPIILAFHKSSTLPGSPTTAPWPTRPGIEI